jgi:hypothetical protein
MVERMGASGLAGFTGSAGFAGFAGREINRLAGESYMGGAQRLGAAVQLP